MLIYELQLSVPKTIVAQWRHWMETVHIPDLLNTRCFCGFTFAEAHQGQADTHFVLWYYLPSEQAWQRYQQQFAARLRQEHRQKFPQVQATRQLLRLINGALNGKRLNELCDSSTSSKWD